MSRNIPNGYLCVDTNGDTYCDTYVREDEEYRNYDARNYALSHYLDIPGITDNDCANFVSAALNWGGKSQTADWWYKDLFGNSSWPWQRAGRDSGPLGSSLYEYLTSTHNTDIFINGSVGNSLRGNSAWENWIATKLSRIRPGDVVFYNDSTTQFSWIHAAIVTSTRAAETTYLISILTNKKKPLIVEHTGPLQSHGLPGAERSIDDTDSKRPPPKAVALA